MAPGAINRLILLILLPFTCHVSKMRKDTPASDNNGTSFRVFGMAMVLSPIHTHLNSTHTLVPFLISTHTTTHFLARLRGTCWEIEVWVDFVRNSTHTTEFHTHYSVAEECVEVGLFMSDRILPAPSY